jgi:hypothetical protein
MDGGGRVKPQTARVLRILETRPTSLTDWDREPAVDGGARITRLAARIAELRKLGFPVRTDHVTTVGRAHIARYRLSQGDIGGVERGTVLGSATKVVRVTDMEVSPARLKSDDSKSSPSLNITVAQAAAVLAGQRGRREQPDTQMAFDLEAAA